MSSFPKSAAVALAVAFVLGACRKPEPAPPAVPAATAAPAAAAPVLEGQLDILAWPGYVERGESDPAYDWVTRFEKDTACKVSVKTTATSDEMVDLLGQGGFDLVTASGDAALRLVDAGAVQAIDVARIPAFATVDPRLQDAPWHAVGGKHYGVPFQWGPNVLMYNTTVFKTPPTSWSVVFEAQDLPDGKSNKGRVQAFDGPIYIADAALYLMAKKPELGITDPYALDETQYAAVLDLLRSQKALVHRYWHDATVQMADFRKEGIAASGAWAAQVNQLQKDAQPVASVIPAEGATGWADTTMLATGAKHPNCAYAWMQWSLDPKVQGDVAAFFGSVPVVPAACTGNPLLGEGGCKANGQDAFDQVRFWRTPEAKCAKGDCVPYSRWTADYAKIVGG